MGKRFIKFRVSRMIPSFQSCREKNPSSLPANPVPLFPRHSPSHSISRKFTHPPSPPPPPPISKPHAYSLKRHVSSALLSARRTLLGVPLSSPDPSFNFQWELDKDRKLHAIAQIPNYDVITTPPRRKIYTSASSDNDNNDNSNDVVVFPPLQLKSNRKRRTATSTTRAGIRRRSFHKIRLSTSSDSGLFSEDDDDHHQERENHDDHETDTLVSTDESTPRRRSNVGKTKPKKKKRRPTTTLKYSPARENNPAPARLSVFMRRMVPCRAVEGKVRESFAVVKKSEDPYEDFKRSMAEMVVEKQMFEASDLEELLRCFLSLNSVHHHDVIVRAFTEIWEALFSQYS